MDQSTRPQQLALDFPATAEIPYGYCHCGCGTRTRLAPQSMTSRCWVRGEPIPFAPNHHKITTAGPPIPENTTVLCECGCGQLTKPAKYTDLAKGWVRGVPQKRIQWHGVDKHPPIEERFWKKVLIGDPDMCWEWQGCYGDFGYGAVGVGTKKIGTHRVAWELTYGPIPHGQCVLHRCDNPPCCNPSHLFLGDRPANNADKVAKGRMPSKLAADDVRDIRNRYTPRGHPNMKELAQEYGVCYGAVQAVLSGRTWNHLW